MQQVMRLRLSQRTLSQIDADAIVEQEHRDSVAQMKANVNEVIITRHHDEATLFERYVQYVKDHTGEFTCHHHKFYWHRCGLCSRDGKQASAYASYYKARVLKALGI
jgi:hypothetical protein